MHTHTIGWPWRSVSRCQEPWSTALSLCAHAGLPPAVFAAAVPNNYGRVVRELLEEVQADDAAMVRHWAFLAL